MLEGLSSFVGSCAPPSGLLLELPHVCWNKRVKRSGSPTLRHLHEHLRHGLVHVSAYCLSPRAKRRFAHEQWRKRRPSESSLP